MVATEQVHGNAEQPGPGGAPRGAVVTAGRPGGQERLGNEILGLCGLDLPG
jgi:hypothetical protein